MPAEEEATDDVADHVDGHQQDASGEDYTLKAADPEVQYPQDTGKTRLVASDVFVIGHG